MSTEITAAGTNASGPVGPAMADRHFLAVDGVLQGPFTHLQLLEQTTPAQAWYWRAGMVDWQPLHTAMNGGGGSQATQATIDGLATAPRGGNENAAPRKIKTLPNAGANTHAAVPSQPIKASHADNHPLPLKIAGVLLIGLATAYFKGASPPANDHVTPPPHQPVEAPNSVPQMTRPNRGLYSPWPTASAKPAAAALANVALTRAQLPLSSVYVEVRWQAGANVAGGCSGTASPALLKEDKLVLLTNLHLLDLSNLGAAKNDQGLQIRQYQIMVKFPSGKVCPVLRFRPEADARDLMALDIDSRLVQQGTDYVVLPVAPEGTPVQTGDEVVAVGNPGLGDLTFENTQTFGHVSAIRDDTDKNKVTTRYIQTDAAVNHGNSGGPLLTKFGDQYWWAGINTMVVGRDQGYQGLNFAIDARQAVKLKFMEFDPSPSGMASYLTSVCNYPASAAAP